jgi:thiol-disulfide isomerase/thioredoxin
MRVPVSGWVILCWCLAPAPQAPQQEDILAKQAAIVREGTISIPELLAGYREEMRRDPANPRGYTLAAAVYDRDESRTLFTRALAIVVNDYAAQAGLARYLHRSEREAEAFAEFRKALAIRLSDRALRVDAINAGVKANRVAEATQIAADDPALRLEVVQTLIDLGRFDAARAAGVEAGLGARTDGLALAVKGRLMLLEAQAKKDQPRIEEGINLLLASWRTSPELLLHYRFEYPRRSLVQTLTDARRTEDLRAVVEKGIALRPDEYPLYEALWKLKFSAAKSDYSAERKDVVSQVEALLKTRAVAGADTLKTEALGYKMATANDDADRINRRLVTEFPYSQPAQMLRRSEAVFEKDLRKKLALLEAFNHDFVTLPMYPEYFATLDELNVPNPELLKGAEELIAMVPYPHAALQVAEVFLKRGIYYDRLAVWLDRYKGTAPVPRDAWAARIWTMRGKLLLATSHADDAERTLRPLPDLTLQGYSNVDRGRAQFYLAEVLEAKRQVPDAMEMAAQAYAQSQHYLAEAGDLFKRLYRQTHGNEQGLDAYLELRDGMYQVAESTGIERGTKLDTPAPDFNLLSLKGEHVTLASIRGKVAIVNFWATWCGPCIAELPHFQEFADQMRRDPGVVVLAVTTDENRALVEPFIKSKGYTFTVLYDEGLRAALGVRGIPATFVIDPKGILRLRMIGFNANEPLVPYLTKLVDQYRAGGVAQTAASATTPAPAAGQEPSAAKAAFQQVDRMPRRSMSDAEWRDAKRKAAADALAALTGQPAGPDVFYVAMLESLAERWRPAVDHLEQYLALPPGADHDAAMNRLTAHTTLRDVFIKGGLSDEGEKYYASDPISLAIFVSMRGDEARTLAIYERYLASNPPPDRARTTKSLILITLGTMRRADEMAKRLDEYRADLTPNAIVNDYSTIARLYLESGNRAMSDKYLHLLFDYGKQSKDDKAVDGPINAHVNWMIKRLESAADPSALNNFIHLVRTEFAGKPAMLANLDSREVFRAVLNQPAKDLEMAYVVSGPKVNLAALRGRVVLLDFFAHWCGPCIADFPIVRDMQTRFASEGLTVLGLTGVYGYYQGQKPLTAAEEVQRMQDHFVKEYQVTWPMIFGVTKVNEKNYGVSYIPHIVLIDRAGVVRFAKVGSGDARELEQEIRKLLAERAP